MKKIVLFGFFAVISLLVVSCKEKGKEDAPTPLYYVAFDLQEKGTAIDTIYVEEGSVIVEPSVPTEEHYVFGGWYKDAEATLPWDFNTDKVTANTTLYAKWGVEQHCCIAVFRTQLSDVKIKNDTIDYNSLVTRPADPESDEYIFQGWYSDKNLTKLWDFENDRVTQKYTYLYAKWTP